MRKGSVLKQSLLMTALLGGFVLPAALGAETGAAAVGSASVDQSERPVAARVNGEPIYLEQLEPLLENRLQRSRMGARQKHDDALIDKLRLGVLEQVIDVELLHQAGRQLDIPDLQDQIAEQVQLYREHPRNAALSEAQLRTAALRQVHINAYSHHRGLNDPEVPEELIRSYYEQNKNDFILQPAVEVRHILLKDNSHQNTQAFSAALAHMETLRAKLLTGEDFSALARAESACASAEQGGDLGVINKGFMPPEFDAVAFEIPIGEISPVIRSDFGLHILRVQSKTEGGMPSYEQMHDFFYKFLQEQLREQRVREEIARLRAQAQVDILIAQPEPEPRSRFIERGTH